MKRLFILLLIVIQSTTCIYAKEKGFIEFVSFQDMIYTPYKIKDYAYRFIEANQSKVNVYRSYLLMQQDKKEMPVSWVIQYDTLFYIHSGVSPITGRFYNIINHPTEVIFSNSYLNDNSTLNIEISPEYYLTTLPLRNWGEWGSKPWEYDGFAIYKPSLVWYDFVFVDHNLYLYASFTDSTLICMKHNKGVSYSKNEKPDTRFENYACYKFNSDIQKFWILPYKEYILLIDNDSTIYELEHDVDPSEAFQREQRYETIRYAPPEYITPVDTIPGGIFRLSKFSTSRPIATYKGNKSGSNFFIQDAQTQEIYFSCPVESTNKDTPIQQLDSKDKMFTICTALIKKYKL